MKKQVGDRVTARDKAGKVIWQPKILKIAKLRASQDFEPTISVQ